jgi:hypothetical protein
MGLGNIVLICMGVNVCYEYQLFALLFFWYLVPVSQNLG